MDGYLGKLLLEARNADPKLKDPAGLVTSRIEELASRIEKSTDQTREGAYRAALDDYYRGLQMAKAKKKPAAHISQFYLLGHFTFRQFISCQQFWQSDSQRSHPVRKKLKQ